MTEKQKYKLQQHQPDEIKESKWPMIITGGIIACLVAAYFIFPGVHQAMKEGWTVLTSGDQERISDWVSQFGFWGPFLIVLAMVVQMFLVVVNVVLLMLVAILAYGPVWGSVIALIAVLVASTIGYLIGRSIGQAGVRKLIGTKSEKKVSDFVNRYGVWAIIAARISPFLSNDAVSFVAGLTGMSFVRFMAATLAGIVPLTILLAWLGENYERLKTGLIWVGGISLLLFVAYVLYDKYLNKHKDAS
ncbi:TVP38/TMEM64 family protein [Pontibacter vulgaris]|uniref:TVP38/TMEM64 family protein n=1 Tax=Pontibacter vulgaris TaxID=2905679 RepID=UPI001FA74455|nr:TVP38/TMEM64 family protein [Pontibacter vulgaris]